MDIAVNHATAADGTFSAQGATEWNAGHVWSGLGTNALLYSTGATALAQDATNLLYTTASGPLLQVGSSNGTSAGLIIGYGQTSGVGGLFWTGAAPSTTNYRVAANLSQTEFNAPTSLY